MTLAFKKLGALLMLVAGIAVTAVGFNGESTGTIVFGLLVLAAGIVLLVVKIVRRNQIS